MNAIEFNSPIIGFKTILLYFVYSLTQNREDSKDLLQDTIYKTIVNRNKFEEANNLKAWLYTIMKDTFINNYRRQNLRKQLFIGSNDMSLNIVASCNNSESIANYKQIGAAINSLEEEYKTPFQLYCKGYKYLEISKTLHLPIGTVKSRIFIARKQLEIILKEYKN